MGKVVTFLVLLFGVLAACSAISEKDEREKLFEEWVEKLRPAMLPRLAKQAKKLEKKHDSRQYVDRSLDAFDVIRMFMNEHGDDINNKVEDIFNKIDNPRDNVNQLMATVAPLTCPSRAQCPPATNVSSIVEKWRSFKDTIKNQPDSCAPCQFLFESLTETACAEAWEPMRDDLINLCQFVLFPLIGMDPVMCNGTITLQGQHIYCIIQEASSFEVCESLDMCYPENRQVSPVRERTPWALKEALQPKLQKKIKKNRLRSNRQKRQNGVVRIVQLTDIHIQPLYAIGAPTDCGGYLCCMEDSIPSDGTEYARRWGEYSCNLPERTMRKFLERVNDFQPDFVLYAGDSPPHTMWDETVVSQLNCSNIVVNAMRNILTPGTRVYPNIGNHEMFPTNLYSSRMPETAQMNQAFTAMWHDLAGLDAQANATFTDMSYYSILHQPGLRVLSINTNYDWYNMNFYNSLNKNDSSNAQHKTFVETTLANARANGEKVVIVGHHPLHSAILRTNRWWQTLAVEYGDVIVLHVSGHTHNDELDLIIDPLTNIATSVNLVSPTVTTNTNINPSMRMFELDAVTFELQDFQCYYFDVNAQRPDEDPAIVLNYDARTDYNMTDLSPASFQDLVLRFLDDEELFQKYYAHRNADVDAGPCLLDGFCGESCKRNQICRIWFPMADESDACVDFWNNNGSFPGGSFPGAVLYSGSPVTMNSLFISVIAFILGIIVY